MKTGIVIAAAVAASLALSGCQSSPDKPTLTGSMNSSAANSCKSQSGVAGSQQASDTSANSCSSNSCLEKMK